MNPEPTHTMKPEPHETLEQFDERMAKLYAVDTIIPHLTRLQHLLKKIQDCCTQKRADGVE